MTHICVSKLTIIGPDNGLSPRRRQAIIWTNAGILLIGPLWTNFSEILIEIHSFSFKKINLKRSSGKWRPFCLGLNVSMNSVIPGSGNGLLHNSTRSLHGPMLTPNQLDPQECMLKKFYSTKNIFIEENVFGTFMMTSVKYQPFCFGPQYVKRLRKDC